LAFYCSIFRASPLTPTHKTETGTASTWETTNSNPLGPIKLSKQSEQGAVNKYHLTMFSDCSTAPWELWTLWFCSVSQQSSTYEHHPISIVHGSHIEHWWRCSYNWFCTSCFVCTSQVGIRLKLPMFIA
jgi:hypothetical protein